jgi:hypothetical protein
MPGSRDADLVAIKARFESNYALVASAPKIASNPLVIAALANAKASEAALYAALAPRPTKVLQLGSNSGRPVGAPSVLRFFSFVGA